MEEVLGVAERTPESAYRTHRGLRRCQSISHDYVRISEYSMGFLRDRTIPPTSKPQVPYVRPSHSRECRGRPLLAPQARPDGAPDTFKAKALGDNQLSRSSFHALRASHLGSMEGPWIY